MVFSFNYCIKPANLWTLSMMNIYRSFTGAVNTVFTASMVLLAVRFWNETGIPVRILIILGICIFPVVQPLLILWRSRNIVKKMPADMHINFTDNEMIVASGKKNSHVDYWELHSIVRVFGMIIIYTRKKEGFILSKEVLADKSAVFFEFLSKQIK